jgi:glycosyltransferase involved in cell wall biosynthesis
MRVAIVTNHFAPYVGGIETQNRLIGEALVRRGHHVTVLTRRYDPALPWREVRNGVRVERLRPSGERIVDKWLMNAGAFRRLLLARPEFDAVLVTLFSVHIFGPALAGALRRFPLVVRTDVSSELLGGVSEDSVLRLPRAIRPVVRTGLAMARRAAYRRARRVIAISRALAREAAVFGFPESAVALIPNAVDLERFRPVTPAGKTRRRAALGLDPDAEIAITVSRLVRRKGLLTLVEAWAGVARDRPRAMLLIVGGGPGPRSMHDAERPLRAAVAARGLGGRVRLVGPVADVERWLQAGDLFVFASEEESFGCALAEAMACGLPVVCTRIEGAAEDLVVEGVHGLTFDVGDVETLRRGLADLLADPAARAAMGAAAREAVAERLGVPRIASEYERVLAAAAGEARG